MSASILSAFAPIDAYAVEKCSLFFENRTKIPIWRPSVNGDYINQEPPMQDGMLVYIDISADNEAVNCAGLRKGEIYHLTYLNNPKTGSFDGGLEVGISGNVQFANGMCYFHGFYVNEMVMGMWQGFIATHFKAVRTGEVTLSGRFCVDGDISQ
jgi:hypothetical protein